MPPTRRSPRLSLLPLVLLLAPLAVTGCTHRWVVEDRETPVRIYLEDPAAANAPTSVPLVVSIGDQRVVDATVRFPAGRTRVAMPPVYVRGGEHVVAVESGGRLLATGSVKVRHAAWLWIRLLGASASIEVLDQEPGTAR